MLPTRFRYGRSFWETLSLLDASQHWDRDALEAYQFRQLERLLRHAYENVPYYRALFDERGLRPTKIQEPSDLQKLPFLTREMAQQNLPNLVAQNLPSSRLEPVTTGGSTGTPLGFYYERGVSRERERAFMLMQWARVGYRMGHRSAVLRGDVVQSKRGHWSYDPVRRSLILSVYHMDERSLSQYVEQLRRFAPDFIEAYPSAGTALAQFVRAHRVPPFPTVKAVLCGSESLSPWQRSLMQEVFCCRVYSWYGLTELGALAGECERSEEHHVFPEYGVLELVDEAGAPVTGAGKLGELVTTGFNNYACPFIRYRTGDLGSYSGESTCTCGRAYPRLATVEGRAQDLVVMADGRRVTLTALIFGQHFTAFAHIRAMQLLQNTPGFVEVRVVRGGEYRSQDELEIRTKMEAAAAGGLKTTFSYVDEIPRTRRGKHRFLIQEIQSGT